MEYYNLIFAVFYLWRLAITTLDKQSYFFIIIFAVFFTKWQIDYTTSTQMNYFILRSSDYLGKDILEIKRLNCLTWNFLGFDSTFDLHEVTHVTLGCNFESPNELLFILRSSDYLEKDISRN